MSRKRGDGIQDISFCSVRSWRMLRTEIYNISDHYLYRVNFTVEDSGEFPLGLRKNIFIRPGKLS